LSVKKSTNSVLQCSMVRINEMKLVEIFFIVVLATMNMCKVKHNMRAFSRFLSFASFSRRRDKQRCNTIRNACNDIIPAEKKTLKLPL